MRISYIPLKLEIYRDPQKSTPLKILIEGEGEAKLCVIFPSAVNYIFQGETRKTNVFEQDLKVNEYAEIELRPYTIREMPSIFTMTTIVLSSRKEIRSENIDTLVFWG